MKILVPVKRVDVLVQAFVSIAAEAPEWDLVIAGTGPLREQIEAERLRREAEARAAAAAAAAALNTGGGGSSSGGSSTGTTSAMLAPTAFDGPRLSVVSV